MASANIEMLKKTGNNVYSDECYTPWNAIIPLVPYLTYNTRYYECTSDRSSSIVSFLASKGYDVTPSSGADFLKDDPPSFIDAIITNPPYSKKDLFIKR